jgi:hypothetical protein
LVTAFICRGEHGLFTMLDFLQDVFNHFLALFRLELLLHSPQRDAKDQKYVVATMPKVAANGPGATVILECSIAETTLMTRPRYCQH